MWGLYIQGKRIEKKAVGNNYHRRVSSSAVDQNLNLAQHILTKSGKSYK